jgi:hypothetical protein
VLGIVTGSLAGSGWFIVLIWALIGAEWNGLLSSGFSVVNAARRLPPPWSVEEQSACFVVRDHNGQALA